jgi:hypothetical protein
MISSHSTKVVEKGAELDFYSASSLKQQSACIHVAALGHIILISSQPVFALSPYILMMQSLTHSIALMLHNLSTLNMRQIDAA